ncbi:MAG: AAA family ATPase [Polyangiaceae bacterium]|nr:AAA family ATPase [Polyangiaceae bacterium]
MLLDPTIASELKREHARRLQDGSLPPEPALRRCYETFAAKFGPAALRRLDGIELLEGLHLTSNKDSLVYWLEFKNDDEMPAVFGSIAGGSALKFGLYRRKETGKWMTGSAAEQEELSQDDAIAMARRNRDQLIAAAEVLEQFRLRDGYNYDVLQKDILKVAPDVADVAWGHKYLSLLFPDLLDDYHSRIYQRFHLIKLGQIRFVSFGRYAMAKPFIVIARELGIPINHLTRLLNERHGSPHQYYRVGTSEKTPRDQWLPMRDGNYVAIGWPKLTDLAVIEHSQAGKNQIKALLNKHYPNDPRIVGKFTTQIFKFAKSMEVGDIVLAADGATVLGIGRVKGDYQYSPGLGFPHLRPVDWLSLEQWKMPDPEGLQTTVHSLQKPSLLSEVERRLHGKTKPPTIREDESSGERTMTPPPPLDGISARIEEALLRKGQVILYGPPGTGKTYWAARTARELAARSWYGKKYHDLSDVQVKSLDAAIVTCTFHPAYGYEDFLEGFRPVERQGALGFERRDGVFKKLCDDARATNKNHYLIIDEINRGDIPRIFGELLTLLEDTKRGMEVTLPLSGKPFSVPKNIFVIGTMNTADRSIALLDAALRRRFGFIELMPDTSVLGNAVVKGLPLGQWLIALNGRIMQHVKRDARNLQIGHTYLMYRDSAISDLRRLVQAVRDDLVPLLEEYCYEDYDALEKILGSSLVQRDKRRIDDSLFRPGREDDLIKALLAPSPELETTLAATTAVEEPEADDEGDDESADGAES